MVLLLDRVARARVVEALRPYTAVVFAASAADLMARVTSGPVSFVILECRDSDGCPTVPVVQTIRRGYPSIPIVAYAPTGRTSSSDILAMAHAGIHELIMEGFDDVSVALRTVAERATRQCAAARVLDALQPDLPRPAVPFIQFCLERSWRAPSVAEAARYLGIHPKTLIYRLRRTNLPPPSVMIGWCRLFVAAHLLEDPHRSVAQVALALDFGSSAALRGMFRRYTGLRPQEIREHGGLATVLSAFHRSSR
jgi:AraC-like DNA-binding protein